MVLSDNCIEVMLFFRRIIGGNGPTTIFVLGSQCRTNTTTETMGSRVHGRWTEYTENLSYTSIILNRII